METDGRGCASGNGPPMASLAAMEETSSETRVRASQYHTRGYNRSPSPRRQLRHPARTRPSPPHLALARFRTVGKDRVRCGALFASNQSLRRNGLAVDRRGQAIAVGVGTRQLANRAVRLRVKLPPFWTERAVAATSTRQSTNLRVHINRQAMGYNVAVVGATGNVGREMLSILSERQFPVNELHALASRARSAWRSPSGRRRSNAKTLRPSTSPASIFA